MQEAIRIMNSNDFLYGILVATLIAMIFMWYSRHLERQANQVSADLGTAVKLPKGFYYFVPAKEYVDTQIDKLRRQQSGKYGEPPAS
jgi:hypothetical protein